MPVDISVAGPAVRRVNQRPLLLAVLLVVLLALLIGWRLLERGKEPGSAPQDMAVEQGSREGVKAAVLALAEQQVGETTLPAPLVAEPVPAPQVLFPDLQERQMQQADAERQRQMEASKLELLLSALTAPTAVGIAGNDIVHRDAAVAATIALPTPANARIAPPPPGVAGEVAPQPGLPADRILRAGSVIPAILLTGIDSELSAQVIAQVGVPVYDTETGSRVLIPSGARLIGSYRNSTVLGQQRLAVDWQTLQRPSGEAIVLDTMPSVDGAGYAGLADQVDRRYWRTFGNATLLGLISAGFQHSAADTRDLNTSASERTADAVGRQWNEMTGEMVRSQLAVGPRIRVRPGYRFNVMVTRDLVFAGEGSDVG